MKLDGKIFYYLLHYWPHQTPKKKKKKIRLAEITKVIVTLICLHVSPPYCKITLISSTSLAAYDQELQTGSTGGKYLIHTAEETTN